MVWVPLRPAAFRQAVKERDKACILTGVTHPSVLQAAHLHPFAKCQDQPHAFARANGITLHAGLHCLFDTGDIGFYFSSNDEGVHLYVKDDATIACLQVIAPRLARYQVVPNFPKECIEYLEKRNDEL